MKIVVIGGTGLIGSKVVRKLIEYHHEAVAAAPSTGVNTLTGQVRAPERKSLSRSSRIDRLRRSKNPAAMEPFAEERQRWAEG